MSEKSKKELKKRIVDRTLKKVLEDNTSVKILKELDTLGAFCYTKDAEKYQIKIKETGFYNKEFKRNDYKEIMLCIRREALHCLRNSSDLSYVQTIKLIEACICVSDCIVDSKNIVSVIRKIQSSKVEFCLELCISEVADDIKWLLYHMRLVEGKR